MIPGVLYGEGGEIISSFGGGDSGGEITILSGEDHIGEVGGNSDVIVPTITVSTDAYTIGDSIGGKIILENALRVDEGTGILQSITVIDAANIKPEIDIILFNSNPTAATLADADPIVFSTDINKISRRIRVASTDYATIGNVAIASVNPSMIVKSISGKNLYVAICAVAAHDFNDASDLQIKFGIMRD